MKKFLLVLIGFFLFCFNSEAMNSDSLRLNKRYGGEKVTKVINMINYIGNKYSTRLLNKEEGHLNDVLLNIFINETAFGQFGNFNGYAYGICQIEEKSLNDARNKIPLIVQYLEKEEGVDLSKSASYYEDKPFESLLLAVVILEYKYFYSKQIKAWNLNNNQTAWNYYKTLYNSRKGKASIKGTQKKMDAFRKKGYSYYYYQGKVS